MVHTVVVGVDVGVQPAVVELVADFACQHMLVLEVEHEVVVHLR